MTRAKIQKIIGDNFDQWLTLAGVVGRIGLSKDSYLAVDPASAQFWFDSEDETLYVRKMTGELKKAKSADAKIPVGCVRTVIHHAGSDFTTYYDVPLMPGGILAVDTRIGMIHEAIDFESIEGFYHTALNASAYLSNFQ